jgi:molybdopterin/thiamine biosynthesis adenylyltransferase/rhodanese-related sulfurtransferase
VLTKEDFQRYNRQIIIPEFGQEGQEKLKAGAVLVIGAGGLGAPILQYLTAAGVGKIGIVEFDEVSISNLQRQVLFNSNQVGKSKALKSKKRLTKLNPTIELITYESAISSMNAKEMIAPYDLVVDGSDNLATRYLVNDACVLLEKPLVYGAIFRFEGQVSVFNALEGDHRGPNYRDLFPTPPPPEMVPSCSEGGVLGVLPGIIGSMMANEAIKLLAQIGESLSGRLFVFDALDFTSHTLNIRKHPDNPISGDEPSIHDLIDYEAFCMGAVEETKIEEITVQELSERLSQEEIWILDVREDYEFEIAHLNGHLIPLNKVVSRSYKIPKDREVVVMCKMGGRSQKAIALLKEQGFDNLVNLKGGINAWQKEIDSSMPAY